MTANTVVVDIRVAQWITDPIIREVLASREARLPPGSREGEACTVQLQDTLSSLSGLPGKLPEVQYHTRSPASPKAEEYFGPVWYKSSQTLYVGHFSSSAKNGRGLLVSFKDGRMLYCYEGFFRDDKQDGTGRVLFSNGDWYCGEFKAGHAHGLGEYKNNSRKYLYVGHFESDLPHGHGKETWEDGAVYVGDFVKGLKHGHGKFTTPEGVLEGSFADGEFHGEGKMVSTSEKVFEGQWKNSVLQSPAKIHFLGARYEGHIDQKYLPHGQGQVLSSSRKIQGTFYNGLLDGDAVKTEIHTGKAEVGFYEKGVLTSGFRGDAGISDHAYLLSHPKDSHKGMADPRSAVQPPKTASLAPAPSDPDKKKKSCFCC